MLNTVVEDKLEMSCCYMMNETTSTHVGHAMIHRQLTVDDEHRQTDSVEYLHCNMNFFSLVILLKRNARHLLDVLVHVHHDFFIVNVTWLLIQHL
jgi:hypothetical protein